jgi:hypothetical protein
MATRIYGFAQPAATAKTFLFAIGTMFNSLLNALE